MRSDHTYEQIDGQTDFTGGMVMVGDPPANGYRYSRNMALKDTGICTRPGIRAAYRMPLSGWHQYFYFNEGGTRFNNVSHTGFWFPWHFTGSAFINIQGVGTFTMPGRKRAMQIVVADNRIYAMEPGKCVVVEMPIEEILEGEKVNLVQANSWLVMFRAGHKNPVRWNGASPAFENFTAPGTTNRIPKGSDGVYASNRLWVLDGDSIFASDALDIDNYEFVGQQFSVNAGDGDEIVRLWPFNDDTLLVFKRKGVYYLAGISAFVDTVNNDTLANHISVKSLIPRHENSKSYGLVGREAVVQHGEQVTFLSAGGVTSLSRTIQGSVVGSEVPLSAPIQPLIDAITWSAASGACAAWYDNYLIFAVPREGRTDNWSVLVYDQLAGGGQGAWVSEWTAATLVPRVFMRVDENLWFIDKDGFIRQMFTDDHFDSQSPMDDTKLYSFGEYVRVGDLRKIESATSGVYAIFRCLVAHWTSADIGISAGVDGNNPNVSSTYWVQVATASIQDLYQISTELWTRWYEHGDKVSPKRNSRAEIVIAHQNPSISISRESPELNALTALYTAQTRSQTAYDTDNQAAWTNTNANNDWWTEGRQDYAWIIPASGFTLSSLGVDPYYFAQTPYRFIPRGRDQMKWAVRIYNTQGAIRVRSIISKAVQGAFAMRDCA